MPADAYRATLYTLIGPDGREHASQRGGTLGGHRGGRIYGRLDCRAALRALANGGHAPDRVFFADEATAVVAGYRPCGVCLPEHHATWTTYAVPGRNRHRNRPRCERRTPPRGDSVTSSARSTG